MSYLPSIILPSLGPSLAATTSHPSEQRSSMAPTTMSALVRVESPEKVVDQWFKSTFNGQSFPGFVYAQDSAKLASAPGTLFQNRAWKLYFSVKLDGNIPQTSYFTPDGSIGVSPIRLSTGSPDVVTLTLGARSYLATNEAQRLPYTRVDLILPLPKGTLVLTQGSLEGGKLVSYKQPDGSFDFSKTTALTFEQARNGDAILALYVTKPDQGTATKIASGRDGLRQIVSTALSDVDADRIVYKYLTNISPDQSQPPKSDTSRDRSREFLRSRGPLR